MVDDYLLGEGRQKKSGGFPSLQNLSAPPSTAKLLHSGAFSAAFGMGTYARAPVGSFNVCGLLCTLVVVLPCPWSHVHAHVLVGTSCVSSKGAVPRLYLYRGIMASRGYAKSMLDTLASRAAAGSHAAPPG